MTATKYLVNISFKYIYIYIIENYCSCSFFAKFLHLFNVPVIKLNVLTTLYSDFFHLLFRHMHFSWYQFLMVT